jgi:hypothetical protein
VSNTSAICHATFVKNGDNYRGAPAVGRHPLLRAFAQQVLAANLASTPEALIIPLGNAATEAVTLVGTHPRRVPSTSHTCPEATGTGSASTPRPETPNP